MTIRFDVPFLPDPRLSELASILAAGIARLQKRANSAALFQDSPESPLDFALTSLERSHVTGLTVHTGVNGEESVLNAPRIPLISTEART